jgi:protein SCO1
VANRGKCGGAALLIALAMACVTAPPVARPASSTSDRATDSQRYKTIEDFELSDQDGMPFRFRQLRGKPALVFFGFTHCPDVCPATLARLVVVTNAIDPKADSATIVMISVDGDRDTPAAMKAYLAQLSPRCIGLTGDPHAVRQIAAQFPAVFFKGLPEKPGGPYAVQHTSQVYLIDRRGRLRATFLDESIDAMRRAIAAVANENYEAAGSTAPVQ